MRRGHHALYNGDQHASLCHPSRSPERLAHAWYPYASRAEASTPACANPPTHLGAWRIRIITPTFSMAEASTPAHAPPSPTHLRVRYMRSIPPCSLRRRPARYPALPIRLTREPGACVVVPHALYGGGQDACQHAHHSLHRHCRGPPLD
jgi:hypothetical protein